jgi:hypothetical protein
MRLNTRSFVNADAAQRPFTYRCKALGDSHVDGLRASFAEAHRRYTGGINARFRWTGYLFHGRFGAVVMDAPHLLAAARYKAGKPAGFHRGDGVLSRSQER